MAEFDRVAAVVAELDTLEGKPGDVLALANVQWTATPIAEENDGSWLKLGERLADEVRYVYTTEGELDPRSPLDAASKVADAVVGTPNVQTLCAWFCVLDEVLELKASEDGGADDETFAAPPGTTIREVVTGGMVTVLTAAAGRLITYLEEIADAGEDKWNEAHAEPEPGAGEKNPDDWVA
jgi:hypothetical protein